MPEPRGPFRPEHVPEGARYEISRGHPIKVAPAGGRHGTEHMVGALPLATDPAVREVGIDVGYALDEHTLRAPDIAVGNVPNEPGWVKGAPRLAVEYADRGTDEEDLQTKIGELLSAGTELVWVARLIGPRRVEVYARGVAPRILSSGDSLEAPGILARALPVDALFESKSAEAAAFANQLAAKGYSSLDAVRAEGHAEGRAEALRGAIEALCSILGIQLDDERRAALTRLDAAGLGALHAQLATQRSWP